MVRSQPRNYLPHWAVAAMPIRALALPGAFGPEAIAAREALDAAREKLGDTDRPELAREVMKT
jgi:hypothetical protein